LERTFRPLNAGEGQATAFVLSCLEKCGMDAALFLAVREDGMNKRQ
jgi:hypothetical protein